MFERAGLESFFISLLLFSFSQLILGMAFKYVLKKLKDFFLILHEDFFPWRHYLM